MKYADKFEIKFYSRIRRNEGEWKVKSDRFSFAAGASEELWNSGGIRWREQRTSLALHSPVILPRRKRDCLYGGRKGPSRWR